MNGKGVFLLTFGILDDFRVARLHDCDAGVCGSQINANNSTKKLEGAGGGRAYVEKLCDDELSIWRANTVVFFLWVFKSVVNICCVFNEMSVNN